MREHNLIEKLLNGVEVEWMPLEDIIKSLKTGLNPRGNFQLNTLDSKGFYVTVREIQNGKVSFLDKTDRVDNRALELINNRSNLDKGDILFSGTGTIGRTAVIEETPINWNIKEGVYVIKPIQEIISSKYLCHLMNSQDIVKSYSRKIVGSPVMSLPMRDLKKLLIPIPCPDNPEKSLEIQAEIVRILDTFTELTAELTARQKQYAYYREQLLTFEEGEVEWKALGDVTLRTSNINWKDTNATYRYIDLTSVCREKNTIIETTEISAENAPSRAKKLVAMDDVIFATTRPTQQRLCLISEEFSGEIASTGYCVLRARKTVVSPKWIYFFITSSRFKNYVEENESGSAYPAISDTKVKEFEIPVPSLMEQERITSILDKFETLTTSIQEGVPREIELRQKQYEYYRNMLLSFPKEEV